MPDTAPPADGSVLTSSYLQTMVREQVVRTVTSATRPSSVEGAVIYETDTDRVLYYDGTGWVIMAEPTQSHTPTYVNITLGNGSASGQYHRSDGYIDYLFALTFGSTTTLAANATISIPIAISSGNEINAAYAWCYDSSATTRYPLMLGVATSTTVTIGAFLASGTYASNTGATNLIPFTWATSDQIAFQVRYRMTTKYS